MINMQNIRDNPVAYWSMVTGGLTKMPIYADNKNAIDSIISAATALSAADGAYRAMSSSGPYADALAAVTTKITAYNVTYEAEIAAANSVPNPAVEVNRLAYESANEGARGAQDVVYTAELRLGELSRELSRVIAANDVIGSEAIIQQQKTAAARLALEAATAEYARFEAYDPYAS